jgi:Protein of unknown function (DUF2809)
MTAKSWNFTVDYASNGLAKPIFFSRSIPACRNRILNLNILQATKRIPNGKSRDMLTFKRNYFLLAIIIFIIEILIALYVKDRIIRPYVGDMLVVILIYCFIKSFLNLPILPVAIFVLLFAFTIEFLQYVNIVEKLGLQKSPIARTVIGTLFEWIDLIAYIVGIAIVLVVEKFWLQKRI